MTSAPLGLDAYCSGTDQSEGAATVFDSDSPALAQQTMDMELCDSFMVNLGHCART